MFKKEYLSLSVIVIGLVISLGWVSGIQLSSTDSGLSFNETPQVRGGTFNAFAEWNESVNASKLAVNFTHSSPSDLNNYTEPGTSDIYNTTYNSTWTNWTIKTNSSWSLGEHLVKIYTDSSWESGSSAKNVTERNLTILGGLNTTLTSPNPQKIYRTGHEITLNTSVRLDDTSSPVQGIEIGFDRNGTELFSNISDSNGVAHNDYSLTDVGVYNYSATIENTTEYTKSLFNDSLTIYQYGWANVSNIYLPSEITQDIKTEIACTVSDNRTGEGIGQSNVSFYDNSSGLLGSAETVSPSGNASIAGVEWMDPGMYKVTCNITDDKDIYYNASVNNFKESTIKVTADTEAPSFSDVNNETGGRPEADDLINFSAYWEENTGPSNLGKARFRTNDTGTWGNRTLKDINQSVPDPQFSKTFSSVSPGTTIGWNIWANDTRGNMNSSMDARTFVIWGRSNITDSDFPPSSFNEDTSQELACRVKDNSTGNLIQDYPVEFKDNYTGSIRVLGSNTTGSNGWANLSYTWEDPGTFEARCEITENRSVGYEPIIDGELRSKIVQVNDTTPPTFDKVGSDPSNIVHPATNEREVDIFAKWADKGSLGYGILRTNETGTWENKSDYVSPKALSFDDQWANFSWMNDSLSLGTTVGWTIWANDTAGNLNDTMDRHSFNIWGWSNVSDSDLPPSSFDENTEQDMSCRVQNAYNSSVKIANYTVEFWDNSSENLQKLGSNKTSSNGWANFSYTWDRPGLYNLRCNITDNATLSYNSSSPDTLTKELEVQSIMPKFWKEGSNVSRRTHINETIGFYANWTNLPDSSQELNYSILRTNETGTWENKSVYGSPKNLNSTETWSNFSWMNDSLSGGTTVGWNIWTNDTWGYWNSSMEPMSFTLWDWSEVNASSSPDNIPRSDGDYKIGLNCSVRGDITNYSIADYPVDYYLNGSMLGTAYTNSNGVATLETNFTEYGERQVTCNISDNASLKYNATDNNFEDFNITVWDAKWSTSGEFGSSPMVRMNWTNDFEAKIRFAASSQINRTNIVIDSSTTNITSNYSQKSKYFSDEGNEYTGNIGDEKCFIQDSDYDFKLKVRNSTGDYTNSTGQILSSGKENMTLVHYLDCPPGRYYGYVEALNRTNHTEKLSVETEFDIPISKDNELNDTTGIGSFRGIIPANASNYHSYYFNTSSIENSTSVKIKLDGTGKDLDAFLFNDTGTLKASSITDGNDTESLYTDITDDGHWEIRLYANDSREIDYEGGVYFTTLNATNHSSGKPVEEVEFGDIDPKTNKTVNLTLSNEGQVNLSNVTESSEVYHRQMFGGNGSENFSFRVPSSAEKIEAYLNWTGDSSYNFSLYKPGNVLVDKSADKEEIAEVVGAEKEERLTGNASVRDTWKLKVRNKTEHPNPYNITLRTHFEGDKWISSNYTNQTFLERDFTNSSQMFRVNLTPPGTGLAGDYRGSMNYESESGVLKQIPIDFNVTSPFLVVNDSVESGEVTIVDNIGFNRTGENEKHLDIEIKNTGNENLSFEPGQNSKYLNLTGSNFMDYSFGRPKFINAGENGNLSLNVSINTTETDNTVGTYSGWILLNDTESQPNTTFNLTVNVNLTNKLDIFYCDSSKAVSCYGDQPGIATQDGDKFVDNTSRDENISLNFEVFLKNNTEVGETPGGALLDSSDISAELREPDAEYEVSNLSVYNDSTGDIWWGNQEGDLHYDPNVSIPASSIPGGYYNVITRADYGVNNVNLSGASVHNHLIINDTGLDIVQTSGLSDFDSSGETNYYRVNATNHGTLESGTLNLDTTCSSYVSITRMSGSPVEGGETESFEWRVSDDDTNTQDTDCSVSVVLENSEDRYYNGLPTDSFQIDTYTSTSDDTTDETDDDDGDSGTDLTCQTGSWEDEYCGKINCGPFQMRQTRSVSPSGCASSARCVDSKNVCGSHEISLTLDEDPLRIVQGEQEDVEVRVRNEGDFDLENLKFFITGMVENSTYTASPSTLEIEIGEESNFTAEVSIGRNSTLGNTSLSYVVNNSDTRKEAEREIIVLPNQEKEIEINNTYKELQSDLEQLIENMTELEEKGNDVEGLRRTINKIAELLQDAEENIQDDRFGAASDNLERVETLYNAAVQEIKQIKAEEKGPNYLFWALIALALIVVGIIVYMMLPPPEEEGFDQETGYTPERKTEESGPVPSRFKATNEETDEEEDSGNYYSKVKDVIDNLKDSTSSLWGGIKNSIGFGEGGDEKPYSTDFDFEEDRD